MRHLLVLLILCATPFAPADDSIMVLKGFGCQSYLPDGLFTPWSALKIDDAFLARTLTGYALHRPFPKQLKAMKDVRLVILGDVPGSALNGMMGRRTLRQYVERGGGLLVFGGPLAYGKGDLVGSMLEDVLPVITTGLWDMTRAVDPLVKPGNPSPLTDGLDWNAAPRVAYYQKVIARPGAVVLLTCDGDPLLVTGHFGAGRIACFTGANLGDETFYRSTAYRPLLGRILVWLMGAPMDASPPSGHAGNARSCWSG